uniref:Ig-like domain-containing protein n=1 Tax=Amphilophus citrinellus TaxID=61819 RepID=A0A3Q0R0J1_AMPCI
VYHVLNDTRGQQNIFSSSSGPTVFPLIPCGSQSGETVTLGCLATGFNPSSVTFSWTKGSTALEDFIQYPAVQKGNVYTGVSQVQVRRQDWGAGQNVQCAVTHVAGNETASMDNPSPLPPCHIWHSCSCILCQLLGYGVPCMPCLHTASCRLLLCAGLSQGHLCTASINLTPQFLALLYGVCIIH